MAAYTSMITQSSILASFLFPKNELDAGAVINATAGSVKHTLQTLGS